MDELIKKCFNFNIFRIFVKIRRKKKNILEKILFRFFVQFILIKLQIYIIINIIIYFFLIAIYN